MLKFNFKLSIFIFILLVVQTTVFAKETFVITDYNVDIDVNTKREYHIKENINTTFTQSSHGIIRSIPLKSSVEEYMIRNVNVSDDEFKKNNDNGELKIKIGDPDKKITGDHIYNISYTLHHIKDDATDGDYAYLNLIGTEWDTTIDNALITLNMPTDQFDDITLTTGNYGLKDKNAQYSVSDSTITVNAQNLSSNEGITIMVKMPEGTFADAPDSFYPYSNIISNILCGVSIAVLLIAVVLFLMFGRDKNIISILEFYPPDNLNPVELGYVKNGKVNSSDVTTLIFYWASKGYLNFEDTGKGNYTLYKLKEMLPNSVPDYEYTAFNNLWSCGSNDTVTNKDLRDTYYSTVGIVSLKAPSVFSGIRELLDKKAKSMSIISMSLAIISLTITSLITGYYNSTLGVQLVVSVFSSFILCIVFPSIKYNSPIKRKLFANIFHTGLTIVIMICLSMIIGYFINSNGTFSYVKTIFIAGMATLTGLFSFMTQKRTDYAHNLLERVVGFKDFLVTAEKDKLEMLIDETPSYFYDILPYALVLDVTDKFANKFADLVTQPPDWYSSTDAHTFSTIMMMNNIRRYNNNMSKDMTSQPQSSSSGSSGSFGGGGFSGGGSGGGGGSSW